MSIYLIQEINLRTLFLKHRSIKETRKQLRIAVSSLVTIEPFSSFSILYLTAKGEKFDMGLLIKLLLQFSHVCGGSFYAALKLPSRINMFGWNKECYIYDSILVNNPLYFEMFFCNFCYFTCKPFTYVAFHDGRCSNIASRNVLFLNFSSRLAEFSYSTAEEHHDWELVMQLH